MSVLLGESVSLSSVQSNGPPCTSTVRPTTDTCNLASRSTTRSAVARKEGAAVASRLKRSSTAAPHQPYLGRKRRGRRGAGRREEREGGGRNG